MEIRGFEALGVNFGNVLEWLADGPVALVLGKQNSPQAEEVSDDEDALLDFMHKGSSADTKGNEEGHEDPPASFG